jgi:hypothetical protein
MVLWVFALVKKVSTTTLGQTNALNVMNTVILAQAPLPLIVSNANQSAQDGMESANQTVA